MSDLLVLLTGVVIGAYLHQPIIEIVPILDRKEVVREQPTM